MKCKNMECVQIVFFISEILLEINIRDIES